MSEEVIDPVISDGEEHELSKEERLELARKKFEELKKKKKKNKKKALKAGSEEPEKDQEKKDEKEKEEEKEKDVSEVETESESKVDEIIEDKKDAEPETTAEPETVSEPTNIETPEPAKSKPVIESEPVTESTPTKPSNDKYVPEVIQPTSIETVSTPQPESPDTVKLQETIDQQKNTIKKLRDENTDLKLSRMDLEDKITELEQVIEQLKLNGGAAPTQTKHIKQAEPVFKTNDYASSSTLAQPTTSLNFREKLMVWKGWQVDMTNWGGSQTSQAVRL